MGKLILVPTPIGNLGDITLRALEVLKSCEMVIAEDTRVSGFLLKHFGISKKILSHHQHNEHQALNELIRLMQEGAVIAQMSDAGTPAISDPGYLLVRECIRQGIEVEVLPGPVAFIPALVLSGLPCDRFVFEGFLPQKKGRQTRLKALAEEVRTIVFYESPFRLVKLLEEASLIFGKERQASVSRELTKKFEETKRGTLEELIVYFNSKPVKGEIVVVIGGVTNGQWTIDKY
jgi:16S rRNA (cytidine1402-2'-O)-methyltransferase